MLSGNVSLIDDRPRIACEHWNGQNGGASYLVKRVCINAIIRAHSRWWLHEMIVLRCLFFNDFSYVTSTACDVQYPFVHWKYIKTHSTRTREDESEDNPLTSFVLEHEVDARIPNARKRNRMISSLNTAACCLAGWLDDHTTSINLITFTTGRAWQDIRPPPLPRSSFKSINKFFKCTCKLNGFPRK